MPILSRLLLRWDGIRAWQQMHAGKLHAAAMLGSRAHARVLPCDWTGPTDSDAISTSSSGYLRVISESSPSHL